MKVRIGCVVVGFLSLVLSIAAVATLASWTNGGTWEEVEPLLAV